MTAQAHRPDRRNGPTRSAKTGDPQHVTLSIRVPLPTENYKPPMTPNRWLTLGILLLAATLCLLLALLIDVRI